MSNRTSVIWDNNNISFDKSMYSNKFNSTKYSSSNSNRTYIINNSNRLSN